MGPVLRDYRAVRRAYRPGNTGRYYRTVLPDGKKSSLGAPPPRETAISEHVSGTGFPHLVLRIR